MSQLLLAVAYMPCYGSMTNLALIAIDGSFLAEYLVTHKPFPLNKRT